VAEIMVLRRDVLRPGLPISAAVFAGDGLPTTTHWGAFAADGRLAAIASLYSAPEPVKAGGPPPPAWQLRGMASAPDFRGQGYGSAVLRACMEWVRASGDSRVLWCNARTGAVGFYLAHGFETVGQEFEIAGVGPHFVMRLADVRAGAS
jgi:GNAT superfamily N-acetyltransferase